jgi:hypothetical protein
MEEPELSVGEVIVDDSLKRNDSPVSLVTTVQEEDDHSVNEQVESNHQNMCQPETEERKEEEDAVEIVIEIDKPEDLTFSNNPVIDTPIEIDKPEYVSVSEIKISEIDTVIPSEDPNSSSVSLSPIPHIPSPTASVPSPLPPVLSQIPSSSSSSSLNALQQQQQPRNSPLTISTSTTNLFEGLEIVYYITLTRGEPLPKRWNEKKLHPTYELGILIEGKRESKKDLNAPSLLSRQHNVLHFFQDYRQLAADLAKMGIGHQLLYTVDVPFPPTYLLSSLGIPLSERQLEKR